MAHQYTTMVLAWLDNVVNNVQPCRCSANGMRRRSDVVVQFFLLVSLHHTFVIHCFTHLCAVSLYISRSSVVHACGRSGQFSKCSIVWGSSVQSHVVSSSQYPHLFILYLHLPTLVLSLLRHCHSHHGNEDPVANDSDGVMFSCVGVDCV